MVAIQHLLFVLALALLRRWLASRLRVPSPTHHQTIRPSSVTFAVVGHPHYSEVSLVHTVPLRGPRSCPHMPSTLRAFATADISPPRRKKTPEAPRFPKNHTHPPPTKLVDDAIRFPLGLSIRFIFHEDPSTSHDLSPCRRSKASRLLKSHTVSSLLWNLFLNRHSRTCRWHSRARWLMYTGWTLVGWPTGLQRVRIFHPNFGFSYELESLQRFCPSPPFELLSPSTGSWQYRYGG